MNHLSTSPTPSTLTQSVKNLNYSQVYSHLNQSVQTIDTANVTASNQIDLNSTFNEPMDCISLIHYDLNLCTNSQQYKMIMSLVNNLVLYFRPRRKQIIDKQRSIKFNLQLSSSGDLESLKKHIKHNQIEAKELLCNIRAMERKLYHLRERIEAKMKEYNMKYGAFSFDNTHIYAIQELKLENKSMEKDYREYKRLLNELSDELNISIGCYKELMLEKRAFNLANTPQFVQHVLNCSKSFGNAAAGKSAMATSMYLSPAQSLNYLNHQNYYFNSQYFENSNSALNVNSDLNLSSYLGKLIQQKQMKDEQANNTNKG